jgi:hypothetical protein
LFLRKTFTVNKPDGFILLKGERNHRPVICRL